MTSTPAVSIIVPAYENPEELERCLQSLQQGELEDESEVIVIDDCSSEQSGAIEQTAQKYNAGYYRQDKNAGPGVARNRGASEARGDILVFIDSDCVAPKGWLTKLIKPIRYGKCLATTACYAGPVISAWITVFQDEDYRYRMPSEEIDTSFVNSCNFAIDKKVFQDCGGFPAQRISEDMVLGLMLSKRGTPPRFLPDAGVRHDYHSTLNGYLKQRFSFAFNTVRSFLDRDKISSKEANSNEQSFNPVRTALGMLFTGIAVLSLIGAVISGLLNSGYTAAFLIGGFVSLILETSVHGRFLMFLIKRQGLTMAISYIPLLYLIDLAYIYAVLRALIKFGA